MQVNRKCSLFHSLSSLDVFDSVAKVKCMCDYHERFKRSLGGAVTADRPTIQREMDDLGEK